MEKEMKKLLLVAISVGVFLLVTITVAIIVISPKTQTQGMSLSSSIPYTYGIQQELDIMSNTPAEQTIINDQRNEIVIIQDTNNAASADQNTGDSLTINIPMPTTAAVPDNSTASTSTARTTSAATTRTVATSSSTSASTSTSTARTTAARTINDYWIQIGAYSAMVRAEDVKEHLASKGLVSIIENREVNGRNLYRVRLGPYTTEREANHWLAIVKTIDGFADSQVRQTIRQQ